MKVNWLWDSRLDEKAVVKILKDEHHPKFNIYAEKLFSRVSDPGIVFDFISEAGFCKKWPVIKKRMKRDRWIRERVIFWQTIYERVHERLKEQGIKIREPQEVEIPLERIRLAHEIRSIRMKSGYTQKDIAKKLGVIQQYISKIESGRENISVDTLKRIADVFGRRIVIKLV